MAVHTSILRTLLLSCCIASAPALAADPDGVPEHTLNSIRRTVRSGEAVMIATVLETPSDVRGAKVRFRVNQTLLGSLPSEVELPLDGFYVGDLQKGLQFLVPLKFQKGQQRWVCSGLYDLVVDGKIRDIPLSTYLARVSVETEQVAAERERRHASRTQRAQLKSIVPEDSTASVQPGI